VQHEVRDDIFSDALGRGGGDGQENSVGEIAAQLSDPAVFRPKIMAPFGDTMRFIDRDTIDPAGTEHIERFFFE